MNNIRFWAFENKMEINWDKTKELVFRRPSTSLSILPDPIFNIEQVLEARLLGVVINGKFTFLAHVNYLLSVCAQRLYLLKLLRQQGLPPDQLDIVYNAIIVSRLTYVLPVWAAFLTADLINRINSMLQKAFKWGYSKQCDNISKLIEQTDNKLFKSLQNPRHCAHWLLPPPKPTVRSLPTSRPQLSAASM